MTNYASTITAAPFTARQCPVCQAWVHCGRSGRGKQDFIHWAHEHATPAALTATTLGFPVFSWNEEIVTALVERRKAPR